MLLRRNICYESGRKDALNRFILDCSVYMSWCLREETSGVSSRILNSLTKNTIVVPSLWLYEVANTLAVSVRRKKLTTAEAQMLVNDIPLLSISFDAPMVENVSRVFQVANEYKLSAYDAAYVELALRLNIPIASLDKDIIRVSKKTGIPLFSG